jgi:hypothetical protein
MYWEHWIWTLAETQSTTYVGVEPSGFICVHVYTHVFNGELNMNTSTNTYLLHQNKKGAFYILGGGDPSTLSSALNLNGPFYVHTSTDPSKPRSDLYREITNLDNTYLKFT